MLGENIKILRQQKGYSQNTLAEQLNVVRQTISKWEKGLSVPDADMLEKLANLFEVPVATLLGSSIQEEKENEGYNEVAKQLAILNEQMVKQSRFRKRIIKTLFIIFVLIPVSLIFLTIISIISFRAYVNSSADTYTARIVCSLDGEDYIYKVTYDDQYHVLSTDGDALIAEHVQVEQYDDVNALIEQIADYVMMQGGTYTVSQQVPLGE